MQNFLVFFRRVWYNDRSTVIVLFRFDCMYHNGALRLWYHGREDWTSR